MAKKTSSYEPRKCSHPGCKKPAMSNGYAPNGRETFKIRCSEHHKAHFAAKKGLSPAAWTRSFHPYRQYMKDYCENQDGHVTGVPCTATIVLDVGMLTVDHIDGNPSNENPDNYQTLCANCHAHKSRLNGDLSSPGRKTLKEAGKKVSY